MRKMHMPRRAVRCAYMPYPTGPLAPLALALSLSLAGAACSSDGGPATSTPDVATGCSNDPRVLTLAGGLTVTGAAKQLVVALISLAPATVTKGVNEWTIELRDATGRPLDGATITVTPYMPDHGHGASVVPTVTALGGGRYDVANLTLPMPGVWQLTFDATLAPGAGGAHDAIVIGACVLS